MVEVVLLRTLHNNHQEQVSTILIVMLWGCWTKFIRPKLHEMFINRCDGQRFTKRLEVLYVQVDREWREALQGNRIDIYIEDLEQSPFIHTFSWVHHLELP